MKTFLLAGLLAIGALLGASCSSIENAVDCNGICERYQSCFDEGYDSAGCQSRCRDNANSDADFMAKVNDCSNCITDKSCASATFTCAAECGGIVP